MTGRCWSTANRSSSTTTTRFASSGRRRRHVSPPRAASFDAVSRASRSSGRRTTRSPTPSGGWSGSRTSGSSARRTGLWAGRPAWRRIRRASWLARRRGSPDESPGARRPHSTRSGGCPGRRRDTGTAGAAATSHGRCSELTEEQLRAPEAVVPYVAFRELVAPLVDDPALPRPARLLDIGAGAGAYGELLERWWPGRFEYVGADYSEEILALARERWPGRTFVHKDVFEPGALDGYDIVLASALLDVLPEVEPALDALLGSDAAWVALHRQRLDERRSRVEVAHGYRGQHTYRSYVTREQLEQAARRHGRRIAGEVVVDGDVRSYLLARP